MSTLELAINIWAWSHIVGTVIAAIFLLAIIVWIFIMIFGKG